MIEAVIKAAVRVEAAAEVGARVGVHLPPALDICLQVVVALPPQALDTCLDLLPGHVRLHALQFIQVAVAFHFTEWTQINR